MPVYEYKCKECSEKFDIMRNMCEEDTGAKCPKCGSTDVERVYSSPISRMFNKIRTFNIPT